MRQVTVELDEMVYKWLEHISEITGKPIESLISSGIGNLIIAFEVDVFKAFTEPRE